MDGLVIAQVHRATSVRDAVLALRTDSGVRGEIARLAGLGQSGLDDPADTISPIDGYSGCWFIMLSIGGASCFVNIFEASDRGTNMGSSFYSCTYFRGGTYIACFPAQDLIDAKAQYFSFYNAQTVNDEVPLSGPDRLSAVKVDFVSSPSESGLWSITSSGSIARALSFLIPVHKADTR